MDPGFRPTEVRMWRSVLPFCGSEFGRAEIEFAAALLVIACVPGDEWGAKTPREIGLAMKEAGHPGGVLHHLRSNPFTPTPDFPELVKKGYAEFIGEATSESDPPVRFTERGYEAIRPYVTRRV